MLMAMLFTLLHGAGADALVFPWANKLATRTGGPDNDDDDDALVRRLMPILAAVIVIAVIFGG